MKRYDHVALALSRLPDRLRKPRFIALATALAEVRQRFEDTLIEIMAQRSIERAVGPQLDRIGAIVRQPRDTSDDVVYRRRIRAKIAVNRSSGLIDDLLRIARLVANNPDNDISIENYSATAVLRIGEPPFSDSAASDLSAFAQRAVSAGVRLILTSNVTEDEESFVFGNLADEIDGGHLASETSIGLGAGALVTWPESGILEITGGSYTGQRFTYVRTSSTTAAIVPALPFDAIGGEIVELVENIVGEGLGDSTETGHPVLAPYSDVAITGGRLTDAR